MDLTSCKKRNATFPNGFCIYLHIYFDFLYVLASFTQQQDATGSQHLFAIFVGPTLPMFQQELGPMPITVVCTSSVEAFFGYGAPPSVKKLVAQ